MYELEPGVVDPLAAGAYRDAAREQQQRKSERVAAVTAASVAAVTAEATVAATGGEDSSIDETERFKLEVEQMVRPLSLLSSLARRCRSESCTTSTCAPKRRSRSWWCSK